MPVMRSISCLIDFLITLLVWFYFICSSVFFFIFLLIPAYIFAGDRAGAFQYLNHIHMRIFFALLKRLIPRTKFVIPKNIREIHSSIIVCNHLSYLDPILLISLLPRLRTIVKSTFFKIPFFGWFLKNTGYMPSDQREMSGAAMINNLESIKKHLASGGNLFVFPEGTRSRNGNLNFFNKGAFSIARYCHAPLALVVIKNTNKLFRPGRFSFNTRDFNTIKVELIVLLATDYQNNDLSILAVAKQARLLFEKAMDQNLNSDHTW